MPVEYDFQVHGHSEALDRAGGGRVAHSRPSFFPSQQCYMMQTDGISVEASACGLSCDVAAVHGHEPR